MPLKHQMTTQMLDCIKVGAVVALERRDGSMAMCSWDDGDPIAVWAKFDVDYPQGIPLAMLTPHLVEAVARNQGSARPAAGYWAATCFKAKTPE
jgi:hypothetical protein